MKVLKIFLSITALFFYNIGIAQSPAIIKYATLKVELLNGRITSINPNVPLSPNQVKVITNLQITNYTKIQAIKKAGGTQKEIINQNQKISAELSKNLLTKEQRKAKKEWGDQFRAGKIAAPPNKMQKPVTVISLNDKKVETTPPITPIAKTSDYPPQVVKYGIKQADRFNDILRNGDPNMILSPEQYEVIRAKAMELSIRVNNVKASNTSDTQTQIKTLRVAYNRDIKTTVLSKAQVTAFNKGWKAMQAAK